MPLIPGNLNIYGNAGQFETDRSTWGFADGDPAFTTVTRSNVQKTTGLCSALITRTSLGSTALIPYAFPGVIGKKYVIRAKVRVPSGTPPSDNAGEINFTSGLDNFMFGMNEISHINKTVLDATDTWVDVEIQVECVSSPFAPNYSGVLRVSGAGILNGQLYVDQLEIYEFTGDLTPVDPPPAGIVQFDNKSFDTAMAPWENISVTPSIEEAFTYDAGNFVQSDGTIAIKSRSTFLAGITDNAGKWPIGDYIVEIIAENLSTGGAAISGRPRNENVRLYGANVISDVPTAISTPAVVFDRIAGDQTKYMTFTLTEKWIFLCFQFRFNFVASNNSKVNVKVKSIIVIDGPIPSDIEEPGEVEIDTAFLSKDLIVLGTSAIAGWESLTNYRKYNEVRVEVIADSGVYVPKFQVDLPPDAAGTVTFYLREAFRDSLVCNPPDYNAITIIRLTDRIKRFKNYTGDLENTEVIPGTLIPGEINLVLYGGIDKYNYPTLDFLTIYLPTNKKFMTWAPLEKIVDKLQEDYLNYWVTDPAVTHLKLQVKCFFDDGTDETALVTIFEGVVFQGLYQIPAGPMNAQVLFINPAKNVTKYELCIREQADTIITEVRTYHIAQNRHPLTRFFMFLNSLGAYEVLRFTGQANEETEFMRETVERFLPHNYDPLDGQFAVNEVTMRPKVNYSSGYINGRLASAWLDYMKDFLLSTRVYDVTNGTRIPVVVTGGTHMRGDQDYKRFIRFEAKPAYENSSYTPKLDSSPSSTFDFTFDNSF